MGARTSCMVQSMVNTVCPYVLGDNIWAPSSQLGMRALRPCCHNSFSVGVWLFVVARALQHMPRTVLVGPMTRSLPHHEVVGLGVVLCVLNFLVSCTLRQTLAYRV